MAREDDDRLKPVPVHEIGQDLSLLSAGECEARIALLESEIARLRGALAKKKASRDAAQSFFKSSGS